MLIISLLKGVPAKTTKVVTVGGVLRREEMDIVMNPHDLKAIEAADFVKRRVGGKTIALTMGPDVKLAPIMQPLYHSEVFGIDEEVILSDRKMAGADTWATAYAVSLGVKKVLERHANAFDQLIATVKSAGYSEVVRSKAKELYMANLLPNRVFSELPPVSDGSIVNTFLKGRLTADEAVNRLEAQKTLLSQCVVLSGIKTTDGETGSVGPQVAESLSEQLHTDFPHVTYVEDFDIDPASLTVQAERRIGRLVQSMEMKLPALLTIATEYRPRPPSARNQAEVRLANYLGKLLQPLKWNAVDLGADPSKLGLMGSPTIVGPGIETGKPPVQKTIGSSLVFAERTEKFDWNGGSYGPFDKADLAGALPVALLDELKANGRVVPFSLEMLRSELFP
jgi:electron transfer flavoprotein beta subunit